ncbi:hypothetical protein J1N35_009969 [Gossypium stocksii]|uniref:Reverse transcriptase domain-containing protein n=1 Tax=Gossypium stocksii TaxID=47602 RepID=A0A9D4ACB1_9ROSI|nr:hypothetical protein J1N35_009969 [Gossypium stocksii]
MNNVVITQEVIHSMRIRKGQKGWMAVKIDMEKAYDQLRWDFFKDTFEDAQLPDNFACIIVKCISTTFMQILWNRGLIDEFYPTNGVRQGDPILPFFLAMEKLGHTINLAILEGKWKKSDVAEIDVASYTRVFYAIHYDSNRDIMKGGLGLRKLVPNNISYLMKLVYQIVTQLSELWVRVLRSKCKMVEVCPHSISRNACSYVWHLLAKVWEQFHHRLYWSLGNRKSVNFIKDGWIPRLGPLFDHLLPNTKVSIHMKVADFVDANGCWKWSELNNMFCTEVKEYIATCHPPNDAFGEDVYLWQATDNVKHRKILTNCERVRRWMTDAASCLVCGDMQEIDLHALRDCRTAAEVWKKILFVDDVPSFFGKEMNEWMFANLRGFQRFIGRGLAVNVELWAILHGLEMAQSRGYDKVIL